MCIRDRYRTIHVRFNDNIDINNGKIRLPYPLYATWDIDVYKRQWYYYEDST